MSKASNASVLHVPPLRDPIPAVLAAALLPGTLRPSLHLLRSLLVRAGGRGVRAAQWLFPGRRAGLHQPWSIGQLGFARSASAPGRAGLMR